MTDYKSINTYPKMNETIKDLLILQNDNYTLYAAKRIEELEAENDTLSKTAKRIEKEIKKQEAFAEEMGFAPDASPYYIARKYKEKFEYAMKELAEARKETFMEIMEMLRFGYELPIDDIAREMAKEYGVEVEE